jgi:uncharacterized protein YjiS (DUF1127 family)
LIKDYLEKKKFIRELEAMSDRELSDIGIERIEIKNIVDKNWGKDK